MTAKHRRGLRSPSAAAELARHLRRYGCLLAVACLGAAAVGVATRDGVGISFDSVVYLSEARQLAAGEGLTVPIGILATLDDVDQERTDAAPSAQFPPLYPLLLSLVGVFADPVTGARWLNAVLLAATALIGGALVGRYTRSRLAACAAAALLVASPSLLEVHSWLWSEPLFLFLAVLALWALAHALERPGSVPVAAAAAVAGAAWTARYVGVALVVTGVAALLARRRLRHSLLFLLVASAPMAAWVGYVQAADALVLRRSLGFHGIHAERLAQGVETVASWLAGAAVPDGVDAALAAVALAALLAAVAAALAGPPARPGPLTALPPVLAIFLLVYPLSVLAAIAFADPAVPLDGRILSPVLVAAVLLLSSLGADLARRTRGRAAPAAIAAAGAALVATFAYGAVGHARPAELGIGLAASSASDSAAPLVRRVVEARRLYSNVPHAIYAQTGREALLLPRRTSFRGHPNPHYANQLARVGSEMRQGRAAVVYFAYVWLPHQPSLEELTRRLALRSSGWTSEAILLDRAG